MTDTLNPTPHQPAADDRFSTIGTDVPAADSRPVGADDRAVIGVFADLDSAQAAVERLAAAGFPIDHISILGKDLQSETRLNGYVTTGDIAGPSAATGAWVGGLFGLLAGSALLFVPGAGPLIVLGPLAAAAIGAVQGALLGGGVGAILGHFVEKQHIPKYEQLVKAGSYLVVVHGAEQDVARAQQVLTDAGGSDVQRHDKYRGSAIGPISQVVEGMRVFDAAGKEVGKVEFVKLGDPEAITTLGEETDNGEPRVAGELRERLLRLGFVKVDRKGFLKSDAYVAADEIDRVQDGAVHLTVTDKEMLKEAGI
jgi:heat induced stress protein YflT